MPRYSATVAYDGTGLVGWQRQERGTSIQGLLEDALFPFEERRIAVAGAGRTDAGVHARGQVAAFTLERAVEPGTLVRALNARLPPAVRVLTASVAAPSFHPRFDAIAKTYRYRISTAAVASPFDCRFVWHLPEQLDVGAMSAAAAILVGRHDFAAFQSTGTDVETTERELFESRVECRSEEPRRGDSGAAEPDAAPVFRAASIDYIIRGDGFLRHMVRAIVGTLVEIGRGRHPAAWMAEVLESGDRARAGATAPPEGLCLLAVEYGPPLATQR